MERRRLFTEKQEAYLIDIIPNRKNKEVIELFERKFDYTLTANQISGFKTRRKIKSGLNTKFEKGVSPWNKGKEMPSHPNSIKTQFKKGQSPTNYRPINSERITKDGYVEIKIADPNKWVLKHRHVYEKVHGKIPAGYAVIFKNRNRTDTRIENLMLVSRKQLAVLNKRNLLNVEEELLETSIALSDLILRIGDKE